MKDLFFSLADHAIAELHADEVLLANFAGEVSDFVRFNHARVRQAMTVRQAQLTLTLVARDRRDNTTLTLSGDPQADRDAVSRAVGAMRTELAHLPADPYLLYATDVRSTERVEPGRLPEAAEAIDTIVAAAGGGSARADLVGIYASGPVYRGFANSLGARHWHQVESFNFEWSLYHAEDRAVKSAYAAMHWDAGELARRIESARAQLAHLARPPRTIEPGAYRAFIAPAALDEFLWMLNWGGVSEKSQRTKQSAIQKLAEGQARLSPKLSLREHTAAGLAPAFDEAGFVRPPAVELIDGGEFRGALVSARTAQEYGLQANGANEQESMQSMELAEGSLPAADALAALGTGVWIGNLWYLNYSDRPNGRITGMTRFASFWVEDGRIVAPLAVMRFDDTLYRTLGDQLVDLTRERDWILNAGTYERRSVETSRVPGALVGALNFTL
jgi:predicted Zn-dependent protease